MIQVQGYYVMKQQHFLNDDVYNDLARKYGNIM